MTAASSARARPSTSSGVRRGRLQAQEAGDQTRGHTHEDTRVSAHSHAHECSENTWRAPQSRVALSRAAMSQVQVQVALSTVARPGQARPRHPQPQLTSSTTWSQASSHTPSLYSTTTLQSGAQYQNAFLKGFWQFCFDIDNDNIFHLEFSVSMINTRHNSRRLDLDSKLCLMFLKIINSELVEC